MIPDYVLKSVATAAILGWLSIALGETASIPVVRAARHGAGDAMRQGKQTTRKASAAVLAPRPQFKPNAAGVDNLATKIDVAVPGAGRAPRAAVRDVHRRSDGGCPLARTMPRQDGGDEVHRGVLDPPFQILELRAMKVRLVNARNMKNVTRQSNRA